jgi:hypothetical protein
MAFWEETARPSGVRGPPAGLGVEIGSDWGAVDVGEAVGDIGESFRETDLWSPGSVLISAKGGESGQPPAVPAVWC